MSNRGRTWDHQVHSTKDLQLLGSAKLPESYRGAQCGSKWMYNSLTRMIIDYYNEGAMDLITLRENESAYDRYRIRPQVLRDLSNLDPSTTIFGSEVKFPFGFSPTAMQGLAHPDGEVATSKATASVNVPMGLSNYASKPLEEVASHGTGNPYMMQMSLLKDKKVMINVLKRAEAAGFKAILVTLDCPYLGRRLNEFRNNFSVPKGMEWPNLFPGVDVTNLEDGNDDLAYVYGKKDAENAINAGFDGIIISNHGGRQLDSVPASLDVLREVAPITKGRIPVAIDGGIRRGTDIFKALALGADFCLAGRLAIWGLAYDGQRGVELALNLLYDEFVTAMALSGCRNVSEINSEFLSLLTPDGILSKL
uniref:FMN hydroxy acid dehydrogenase domain-containing protein n=1 Tax=Bionectria ochroleuca TaxID=29856 RepID=A0A0B7K771_BIOOC